jgi:hypothetical protein
MMVGMITLILTGLTDPALACAREPRVAAPTGRPLAHRAASTAANRRPPVLGPAVRPVGRLDGCHLRRPTRHCVPVAADRLQALLGLEEPPERAGPGRPALAPEVRALIRHMYRATPLWGAPRIHGELQKLASRSHRQRSPRTPSAIERRHRKPGESFSRTTFRPSSPWTSSSSPPCCARSCSSPQTAACSSSFVTSAPGRSARWRSKAQALGRSSTRRSPCQRRPARVSNR